VKLCMLCMPVFSSIAEKKKGEGERGGYSWNRDQFVAGASVIIRRKRGKEGDIVPCGSHQSSDVGIGGEEGGEKHKGAGLRQSIRPLLLPGFRGGEKERRGGNLPRIYSWIRFGPMPYEEGEGKERGAQSELKKIAAAPYESLPLHSVRGGGKLRGRGHRFYNTHLISGEKKRGE